MRNKKLYSDRQADRAEDMLGDVRIKSDLISKRLSESRARAKETYKNRTPEIKEMQTRAQNRKLADQSRMKEILFILSSLLDTDFEKLMDKFMQICEKESLTAACTKLEDSLKADKEFYNKLLKLKNENLNNYSEQVKAILEKEFANISVPTYKLKEYKNYVANVLEIVDANGIQAGLEAIKIEELTDMRAKPKTQKKSILLENGGGVGAQPIFETIVKKQSAKNLFNEELAKRSLKYMILQSAEEVGVEETVKRFASDLESYQAFSDEYMERAKGVTATEDPANLYNKLFQELIDKNEEFLRVAPIELLLKNQSAALHRCNAETRSAIQTRLEENNMINKMSEQNLRFFPDYIGKIRDASAAIYCLTLDDSKFSKLDNRVKLDIYLSPLLLMNLIANVPSCLQYLPEQQIEMLYDNNASGLGGAIIKYPNNLNALPDKFFAYHNPMYLFKKHSKAELVEIFKNAKVDISRFKELVKFLNVSYKADGGVGV